MRLPDLLPLRFEALRDGHDDLQTVLADPSRVGALGHRQDRIAVPHHHLDRVADDAPVHQRRASGQGRHQQSRRSGSAGAKGEVGGLALIAHRGRDAGFGAAVAGDVAGLVVVGEDPGGGGADARQTGTGLANQGWKDSGDAARFADGRFAEAPLALAEVQGYAYEAALAGAALLDAFGLPDGERWRTFAAGLADRFRGRFWVSDQHGPYPAMALDGSGLPVDSVTSNMGHLLSTGILNADETAAVAARLTAPDMSDAYGLRTMSSTSGGYGPLRYHCGTVWPHDTAIAVTGLARSGHPDAAARLIEGILAAAPAFDYRLPELWGGDARTDTPAPVPYPAACRPQAWSAAAAIALMTAMTGLEPDVPAGRLHLRPTGPLPVGALTVTGLTVAGERLDITIASDGRIDSVSAPAGLTVEEHTASRA
ncbi:amylo-alpha-1,6-glucosidase [Streptomyces sp. NPDC058676]